MSLGINWNVQDKISQKEVIKVKQLVVHLNWFTRFELWYKEIAGKSCWLYWTNQWS